MHQSVHRYRGRKRVGLCIIVSTATGEGKEWLYASECPQPQGKEENDFKIHKAHFHDDEEQLIVMHRSVHSHRSRKRVTSGYTKLIR